MAEWYVGNNGKQYGPTTEEEIRSQVASGALSETDSLAWKEGMEKWLPIKETGIIAKPASALEANGLPKPNVPAPAAATPPPRSQATPFSQGYQAPTQHTAASANDYPGWGRLTYFLVYFIGSIVFMIAMALIATVVIGATGGSESGLAGAGIFLGVLYLAFFAFAIYCLYKRTINLGMSGLAVLWTFVPFINMWFGWRLIACPAGYDDHKQLDKAGKTISWILGGFLALYFLIIILAVVLGVATG